MKIQQENIHEYPKILEIREIRENFLSWTIPIIRYIPCTVLANYICIPAML